MNRFEFHMIIDEQFTQIDTNASHSIRADPECKNV